MADTTPAGNDTLDYLIVGAGPAGLQLGYYLEQTHRRYLILEEGPAAGSFFTRFPRHRVMISNNKVHTGWDDPELNLRMDWNSLLTSEGRHPFGAFSQDYFPRADDMVRYLRDFAETHALRIAYDTRVTRIERDGGFRVTSTDGMTRTARRLVMATGVSKLNVPDIPGIEHAEQYASVPVDPTGFTDQRVLVIGKANSAFETADNLIAHAAVIHVVGPHSLRLAWRTHFVGHLRAVNNNLLDTYQLKSQNAILDGTVKRIVRDGDGYRVTVGFTRVEEVSKDIYYDRVIACTGFRFDASVFDEACRPELTIGDRFPAQTSVWESVNIPDLYFAGTITQARDFKKSTSGFIHGFRYNARALHHVLEARYEGLAWPSRDVAVTAGRLADAVVERVGRSSALWQQFGFLGDVLVVPDEGRARYHEELPVAYAREDGGKELGAGDHFLVTLEYGPDHDQVDPFDVTVRRAAQNDTALATDARYLHPVVRHLRDGEVLAEHHLAENLENEWDGDLTHRQPLAEFFARCVARLRTRATATEAPAAETGTADA